MYLLTTYGSWCSLDIVQRDFIVLRDNEYKTAPKAISTSAGYLLHNRCELDNFYTPRISPINTNQEGKAQLTQDITM